MSAAQAWRATKGLYCRRICGMSPGETVHYDGPIPVDLIVNAAPVPASASVYEHQVAWAELKRIFTEEADQHRSAA